MIDDMLIKYLNEKKLTQDQRWRAIDTHMSDPIPLKDADLTKPFVYDREYGVFYVAGGYHPSAMSLLLAWHHGYEDPIDYAMDNNLDYYYDTADKWLKETKGAAFKSSVGKRIQAGPRSNFTLGELKILGEFYEVHHVY